MLFVSCGLLQRQSVISEQFSSLRYERTYRVLLVLISWSSASQSALERKVSNIFFILQMRKLRRIKVKMICPRHAGEWQIQVS